MPTILLLSTADTELLAARASGADYRTANPARMSLDEPEQLAALTDGATLVVLRLLGGRQAWPEGIARLRATGLPLVALGGESAPDAELMALSTVPAGVAAEALGYLREGGPANLRELAAFLSDTVLLTGEGFAPPETAPAYGLHHLPAPLDAPQRAPAPQRASATQDARATQDDSAPQDGALQDASASATQGSSAPRSASASHDAPAPVGPDGRPTVAVIFYRAHELSGNTGFVDTLCAAIAEKGGTPLAVYCSSLRSADPGLAELLRPARVIITTVLAAGGSVAADQGAEGDWDAGALAGLGVPLIQGLCLTSSRAQWQEAGGGLSPIDAAMQVAIPEFDGRLIAVPFSFKEEGPEGIPVYAADEERAGLRASPSGTPGWPSRRTGISALRSCCLPTRRSTPGLATQSASTPRPRRSVCCKPCARPDTTSATDSPKTATR